MRSWSIYTIDTLKTEKNKFFTIHFDAFIVIYMQIFYYRMQGIFLYNMRLQYCILLNLKSAKVFIKFNKTVLINCIATDEWIWKVFTCNITSYFSCVYRVYQGEESVKENSREYGHVAVLWVWRHMRRSNNIGVL